MYGWTPHSWTSPTCVLSTERRLPGNEKSIPDRSWGRAMAAMCKSHEQPHNTPARLIRSCIALTLFYFVLGGTMSTTPACKTRACCTARSTPAWMAARRLCWTPTRSRATAPSRSRATPSAGMGSSWPSACQGADSCPVSQYLGMQCTWGMLHGRAQRARIGVYEDAERERFLCLTTVQARNDM